MRHLVATLFGKGLAMEMENSSRIIMEFSTEYKK